MSSEALIASQEDIQPFFTIIEDAEGDIIHPQVHYVFSDDDPELLTSAAIEHPHRVVLIDTDGKSITNVSSLSPDWQAVRADISQAPSWGDEAAKGFMLRITGKEATTSPAGSLDELVASFDREMESLVELLGCEETKIAEQAQIKDESQHGSSE
ncbi:hypothetical protein AMS68_003117 [Peltaster fructicola]|uniref:Uncharacterized protein n=1 Tax=Peltaster fructicola TaxID=286661 RepID=A0A6H0XT15_9PEZI|nr:hypothetical protein AMS68_003117 [Peltaster fructicola]